MRVTTEQLDNCQILMTVEADQSQVNQELQKAARKHAKSVNLPGFRKGKAPFHVIVQHVGLPKLYSEFIDKLAEENYQAAILQEGITPYGQANMHELETLEPLTFKYTIPMEPEIDLSDYRNLRIEEVIPEINDADVDEALEKMREPHAGWVSAERASANGDMMIIDVKSVLVSEEAGSEDEASDDSADDGDEGASNVVLDEEEWEVTLDEENPLDPPGLDEELLGMAPGEEKEFDITWPDDIQSIYAGQTAHFHVSVHQVKGYESPALDDAFAKTLDEEVDTLEELRTKTKEGLEETARRTAENAYLEKAMTLLLEQSTLNYPPIVVHDQMRSILYNIEQQVRQIGFPDLKSFLEQTGQDLNQYQAGMQGQAEMQARQSLVISELIQAEEIQVSDEEIDSQVETLIETLDAEDPNTQRLVESLATPNARMSMVSDLLRQKAIKRLLAIVRGEVDFEAEEQAKKEAAAAAEAKSADAEGSDVEGSDAEVAETETEVVSEG